MNGPDETENQEPEQFNKEIEKEPPEEEQYSEQLGQYANRVDEGLLGIMNSGEETSD